MKNNSKILIIDDEEGIRYVLKELLLELGYNAETCSSAEQAISLINANKFDLIITDIILPKMNGIDLTKHLLAEYEDLKIVVMSGGGDSEDEIVKQILLNEGARKGALSCLKKPFTTEDVIQILKAIV